MYCDKCGALNDDNAKFCGACGSYIQKKNTDRSAQNINSAEPIIINVNNGAVLAEPVQKLEDGFFFKGLNIFEKAGVYALGVFLTFLLAAVIFLALYPEYLYVIMSYINRLIY